MEKPIFVKTDTINTADINVATFNADPFAVDNEDLLNELLKNTDTYVKKYTSNTEGFNELCELLNGDGNLIKDIYVADKVVFGTLK